MLNENTLKKDLQNCIEDTFTNAFYQVYKNTFTGESKESEKLAKKFAKEITDQIAEPLADGFASAIFRFVKSANVKGKIWTIGNKVLQKATVMTAGKGVGGGSIPNVLTIE